MIKSKRTNAPARPGFTIIEATMSTLIVAGVLAVTLNCVAASRALRSRTADRLRAQQLAMDLLAEVLQQSYQPAVQKEPTRPSWTDVDHYNGLVDSPPQTKSGTAIPDCTSWTRTVSIVPIDPTTLAPANSSSSTGIKRITVIVKRGTLTLASVAGYRTSAWADVIPSPSDATGNHAPTASATGSPLTGGGGHLNVNFDGSASSDPDGDQLSYVWNFGDGATAVNPKVTHSYTAVGTYSVTLTVYDGRGGVGIGNLTVVVNP